MAADSGHQWPARTPTRDPVAAWLHSPLLPLRQSLRDPRRECARRLSAGRLDQRRLCCRPEQRPSLHPPHRSCVSVNISHEVTLPHAKRLDGATTGPGTVFAPQFDAYTTNVDRTFNGVDSLVEPLKIGEDFVISKGCGEVSSCCFPCMRGWAAYGCCRAQTIVGASRVTAMKRARALPGCCKRTAQGWAAFVVPATKRARAHGRRAVCKRYRMARNRQPACLRRATVAVR